MKSTSATFFRQDTFFTNSQKMIVLRNDFSLRFVHDDGNPVHATSRNFTTNALKSISVTDGLGDMCIKYDVISTLLWPLAEMVKVHHCQCLHFMQHLKTLS